jgi:hypothetical protein
MKRIFAALFGAAFSVAAPQANASTLDISVALSGGALDHQAVFINAISYWENRISGRAGGYDIGGPVQISATSATLGAFAQSTPTLAECSQGGGLGDCTARGGIVYSTHGIMQFDFDAIDAAGPPLMDVIVQEIAKVLGFGSLWAINGLSTPGTGQYTGAHALSAYQAGCDASATFVPVELDSGQGQPNVNWDEDTFACGSDDIMTGTFGSTNTISDTTLAAFEDLGYDMTPQVAPMVPLPAGGVLFLTALAGLVAMRGRKRAG